MKKYDKTAKKSNIDKGNTFIVVDSPGWRQPEHLDIQSLRDILEIDESANVSVYIYKFKDQDKNVDQPPSTYKLEGTLNLAADENFLYVWVEKNKRWKRVPLTEF